jgi:hypothetical protein
MWPTTRAAVSSSICRPAAARKPLSQPDRHQSLVLDRSAGTHAGGAFDGGGPDWCSPRDTTHFIRPVTAGRVSVTAVALNQGRTQQLWQVDIKDQAGRLVAHGELRLQNVGRNAGAPPLRPDRPPRRPSFR